MVSGSSLIRGAGAQIEPGSSGVGFIATISAFDAQNNELASYSVNGTNGIGIGPADNSAIFVGILDPTASIASVSFAVTLTNGPNQVDLAINQLDLVLVPEPGTHLLLGAGLAGLAAIGARRWSG
jgi:hypothetical protein